MTTGPPPTTVRPAVEADLDNLQALARHTVDTCYRGFLGDDAVDWFIDSGASDTHVRASAACCFGTRKRRCSPSTR